LVGRGWRFLELADLDRRAREQENPRN
jgi:hypothetical protein